MNSFPTPPITVLPTSPPIQQIPVVVPPPPPPQSKLLISIHLYLKK